MDTYRCPEECFSFCKFRKRAWLFFGNGIFNTKRQAEYSADILRSRVAFSIGKYPDLAGVLANKEHIDVAYNIDGNAIDQIIQTYEQKFNSEFQNFWRWLGDFSIAPVEFRNQVTKAILEGDEGFEERDAELKEQVAQYSKHLEQEDGVIVVSHSQGNFYSHAAFRLLMQEFGATVKFKIIPIASPHFQSMSEKLFNGMPYTTLFSDWVIRSVPHHFPPNTKNEPAGLFDHQFVEHYLNGNHSGPKILSDINCLVSSLIERRPHINSWLESDYDHEACKALVPHPERTKEDDE